MGHTSLLSLIPRPHLNFTTLDPEMNAKTVLRGKPGHRCVVGESTARGVQGLSSGVSPHSPGDLGKGVTIASDGCVFVFCLFNSSSWLYRVEIMCRHLPEKQDSGSWWNLAKMFWGALLHQVA